MAFKLYSKLFVIAFTLFSCCSCAVKQDLIYETYFSSIFGNKIEVSYNRKDTGPIFRNEVLFFQNCENQNREDFNFYKQNSRIYFKYNVATLNDENNDAKFLSNNAFILDVKNNVSYTFKTETADINYKLKEINEFTTYAFNKIENYCVGDKVIKPFNLLATHIFYYINNPYFHVNSTYHLWKYRFNDVSSFYILAGDINFLTAISKKDEITNISSKWFNYNNGISLSPVRIYSSGCYNDVCYESEGGQVLLKEAFPCNNSSDKEIISTYNNSLKIGDSLNNGFYANQFSDSNNKFVFTKEYKREDPILVHNTSLADNSAEWFYKYKNPIIKNNKVKIFYLFEMNNESDFNESEMLFDINYFVEMTNGKERKSFKFNNFVNFDDFVD